MRIFNGFIVGVIGGILIACGSGGTAHDGPSTAEFNAALQRITQLETELVNAVSTQQLAQRLAPLASRVSTAEAAIAGLPTTAEIDALELELASMQEDVALASGDVLTLASDGTTRRKVSATESETVIGTLVVPVGGNPLLALDDFAISANGYYFKIARDGTERAPGQFYPVYFTGPNCTGSAYLLDVANGAALQGFVFATKNLNDDPSRFLMLRAGTALTRATMVSRRSSGVDTDCESISQTNDGFLVEPNDPQVSGVPSGAWIGNVRVGGPGG